MVYVANRGPFGNFRLGDVEVDVESRRWLSESQHVALRAVRDQGQSIFADPLGVGHVLDADIVFVCRHDGTSARAVEPSSFLGPDPLQHVGPAGVESHHDFGHGGGSRDEALMGVQVDGLLVCFDRLV